MPKLVLAITPARPLGISVLRCEQFWRAMNAAEVFGRNLDRGAKTVDTYLTLD